MPRTHLRIGLFVSSATMLSIFPVMLPAQLTLPLFDDVPLSAPYFNHVALLRTRMITVGCSAEPTLYCPEVQAVAGLPPTTRGQMAVLIIRSIYSALNGNPEGFTPANLNSFPLFQDVNPSTHPQAAYIYKLRELGITLGCYDGTNFCPDAGLTFAEAAIFMVRAQQLRLSQPILPLAACEVSIFEDVHKDDYACPYLHRAYYLIGGPDSRPTGCAEGLFCRNAQITRGKLAFYLVTGIMRADFPQNLPNSSGQLASVVNPGTQCSYESLVLANEIRILPDNSVMARAESYVENPGNPARWSVAVEQLFQRNGQTLVGGYGFDSANDDSKALVTSSAAQLDPQQNYRNNSIHQFLSTCLSPSSLPVKSVGFRTNDPALLAPPPVLFRGVDQTVAIRGSGLSSPLQVRINGQGVSFANNGSTEYELRIRFTTPASTPSGSAMFQMSGLVGPDLRPSNEVPVQIADPTPVITSVCASPGDCLSPLQMGSGTTVTLTIDGSGFGTNPIVRVGSLTASVQAGSTTTRITATLAIPPNFEEDGDIYVESQGGMGSGFAPAPPPQTTTNQSNRKPSRIRKYCTTITITEETIRPSLWLTDQVFTDSLPVYNPVSLRNNGTTAKFFVSGGPDLCTIRGLQWSISGEGSVVSGGNSEVVTVRSNQSGAAVGTFILTAAGQGVSTASNQVEYRPERRLKLRVGIVRDDNGQNAATDQSAVNAHVQTLNSIFEQIGIQFDHVATEYIDDEQALDIRGDEVLDPGPGLPPNTLNRLMGWFNRHDPEQPTDGFEVYYVRNCDGIEADISGWNGGAGLLVCTSRSRWNRTLAHEIGHALGLDHPSSSSRVLHLMAPEESPVKSDIRRTEKDTVYQVNRLNHQ